MHRFFLEISIFLLGVMNQSMVVTSFQSHSFPSSSFHTHHFTTISTRRRANCNYNYFQSSTTLLYQHKQHQQQEYSLKNKLECDNQHYVTQHSSRKMNWMSNTIFGLSLSIISILIQPQISNAEINSISSQPTITTTITMSNNPQTNQKQTKKSRYWEIMESNDPTQISNANEKLLDNAVGTINTMYYDNSGGAKFSPKDMYDRWKVLRVYATDGIDGVKALNSMSKSGNESLKKSKGMVKQSQTENEEEQASSLNQFSFMPQQLFTVQSDVVKMVPLNRNYNTNENDKLIVPPKAFDTREDAVTSLKWLVSTLDDPFSKYLTREELQNELRNKDDGFLGLGLLVESPPPNVIRTTPLGDGKSSSDLNSDIVLPKAVVNQKVKEEVTSRSKKVFSKSTTTTTTASPLSSSSSSSSSILSITRASNLPTVTAVVPDSPAERAGIVVGDRIAAIGTDKFVGMGRDEIIKKMNRVYKGAEGYYGYPDLTVAKPLVQVQIQQREEEKGMSGSTAGAAGNGGKEEYQQVTQLRYNSEMEERDEVVAYKLSRVRLPTLSLEPYKPYQPPTPSSSDGETTLASTTSGIESTVTTASNTPVLARTIPFVSGGDAIVHYELLTPNDSIFRKSTSSIDSTTQASSSSTNGDNSKSNELVGYIRLTRFSRTSTAGYVKAVEELEKAGAQSFIIDVRNNYGGVIQESMLVASTLLRDPHSVLCYTMNSRGGFTPHDAEEYIVDKRYPGYLLSSEPKSVTMEQVKRDDPEFVNEDGSYNWVPPSSYASLHEQRMKRGISRPSSSNGFLASPAFAFEGLKKKPFGYNQQDTTEILKKQLRAQKKVVILMNEGTASAAEVFVSSLHDNGRTVGLVGTKTYGKGLIQHTFPMSDGGGLRLTVAEYLTPALQHVTKVGESRYDKNTGELVGGGVRPDIYCPSTQGIPSNIGADICVGVALDAIEDAEVRESLDNGAVLANYPKGETNGYGVSRIGGSGDGSVRRRTITQGIAKDDF